MTPDATSTSALRSQLAASLADRSVAVTRAWVDLLQERLDVDATDVLPTETILDHIPACLRRIAESVGHPDRDFPDDLVRDKVAALVQLRRTQGFGVNELLEEYGILADLLQAELEGEVGELTERPDDVVLTAVIGELKDAFARFGVETARAYRIWAERERRERAMQTTTFAAMLRHELRNCLGSAQTAAELLSEEEVDPNRRRRLARLIVDGVSQALETVDVVRDVMAEQPVGPVGAETTWVDLSDLVQGIVRGYLASDPRIDVRMPDGTVEVPGTRVGMVLLNLVDNAIKYHDEDGQDRWVRILAEPAPDEDGWGDGWLRLSVEDNGRGIDDDLQATVFEFSVRGDDPASGSGLGLALARDIVDRMGGRIDLASERGRGTRVSFVVPSRVRSASTLAPAAE